MTERRNSDAGAGLVGDYDMHWMIGLGSKEWRLVRSPLLSASRVLPGSLAGNPRNRERNHAASRAGSEIPVKESGLGRYCSCCSWRKMADRDGSHPVPGGPWEILSRLVVEEMD